MTHVYTLANAKGGCGKSTPAQFQKMSDAEKLSRPSYQSLKGALNARQIQFGLKVLF